mmetsp:Transcript_68785/g.126337  ORF Transcript_68785/g.126337 Transcript_68785/m.126337 type:complete len:227 (-) Transcript_68785:178-858(-)
MHDKQQPDQNAHRMLLCQAPKSVRPQSIPPPGLGVLPVQHTRASIPPLSAAHHVLDHEAPNLKPVQGLPGHQQNPPIPWPAVQPSDEHQAFPVPIPRGIQSAAVSHAIWRAHVSAVANPADRSSRAVANSSTLECRAWAFQKPTLDASTPPQGCWAPWLREVHTYPVSFVPGKPYLPGVAHASPGEGLSRPCSWPSLLGEASLLACWYSRQQPRSPDQVVRPALLY